MPLPYTYFVKTSTIVGAPSDSVAGVANGRDPLGCALSNASYDHTGGGSGERQLTAASGTPFASVQAGDYIYLLNAAGGVADGLYEIASVPSSTVVLLSDDSGLTADSTSDVDSSDGPWATVQYALDTAVTDGDNVVLCDDGNGTGTDWEPSVTLDVDTGAGNFVALGRHIRGATGRGVVDGTVTTLSGASLGSSTNLVTAGNNVRAQCWYDMRFTGATLHNIDCYSSSTSYGWSFFRCRIDNASSNGIRSRTSLWSFQDCEVDNNGANGFGSVSTPSTINRAKWNRCRIHNNGSVGISDTTHDLTECLVYRNGSHGVSMLGIWTLDISTCVFFANTGSGVHCSATWSTSYGTGPALNNCVFRSNGAYGVNFSGTAMLSAEIDYCCFHNNTSGDVASDTARFLGQYTDSDNNIYVDPQFTSETDGSEDFTPASGSPLIAAGIQVPVN